MIPMNTHRKGVDLAINAGALCAGIVLFAGSFPCILFENGLPFLAWIAYIPVFWLIGRIRFRTSFVYGALYGYGAYSLFNYWLSVFHPLAGLIVDGIYLFYFVLLFPLLKAAILLFPKRGYVLQWLLWISFEYLRTLGFLGYPYGITGYSQWQVAPVRQIAAIFGVWGVSALVVFPSVFLAAGILRNDWKAFWNREKIPGAVWIAAFIGTLVYGSLSPVDYSSAPSRRIALIQHNTDPWRGGIAEYRRNLEVLIRLSDESLKEKPDMVVWSETAFVPRIYWHDHYRDDPESWDLVKKLREYVSGQTVPFVIGNDDARKDPAKSREPDQRVDYNAVMLFNRGEILEVYRKIHLVPFTEYFPYEKQFPFVYKTLKNADTHFWEQGTEETVFSVNGIKFSTPICFEDTFGDLSRNFVRNGAELLINVTNDAWSNSLPAQMQHLSMAVFRAVENRRALVRSTASGQTCAIDPNGKILAMAEPFAETQIVVTVPLMTGNSVYTAYGDFLPRICMAIAAVMIAAAILRSGWKKIKRT
ncbi:apolipoprotein N-acyltransferase 1 [Spirochaetia bacterium]|nr:apolipoprotein N-acyltransferase 1 [Spirochaetia bacterium]